MSAQIVEHIVLFKVKPDTDPSKADSMVNALNGLRSLDQVLHLTAGPLHRTRSSPSLSPTCSTAATDPRTISTPIRVTRPTSARRGHLGPPDLRRRHGRRLDRRNRPGRTGPRKEVLGVIGGIKDRFPAIDQISVGENFSPARAKGFSICSIAFLPRLSELEALDSDSNSELVESEKSKVRGMLESVMVLDYVIPQLQGASL
ncbi:stress responsive alpha-beta barrel domain protein [Actinidia rufa]|uniref:Stress responsive alpha-beta barrel domain protein n=1 Tax=Actinidia rufa TaxID=165716 RepID=A0A7J0DVH3_9ERIC|nr:stress responsive alpha-beta barrel domain protein [Actinidia rufa]